ncbi:MAG TPA: Asp-tRNA(Asn)/Glu-tRNA(Gln) amidotransferase subunit GatA [Verrucomicrobiales bacterium]|nr:Asp-tRNA(Asn)/Glu-tRNA(Gln) amidotransferase subunit GatA [Verrucomicrobiales bacterium]
MRFEDYSLIEIRALLRKREITAAEVVRAVHEAIEERDSALGAYLTRDLEAALEEAGKADAGALLGGIPVALKDNISVRGQPCSCGSRILAGKYTAPFDAGAVQKLRAAGGIPFGRTNLDEFAMGSSTENSALQATRNPWSPDHVPGGSSGGSAAAVAGGEALGALGSDTGGSIRQPAAFCGCVGLKPSYGRVSRYGLVAYASSLDQIGPLARSVEDAALLYQAIAGHDPKDSTSLSAAVDDSLELLRDGVRGWRVGIPREYIQEGIDPQVRQVLEAAASVLEEAGVAVEEVSLPHTEQSVAAYYVIATAEASANLARFDGVRYGHRSERAEDVLEMYCRTRDEGFGAEVKRRILLGTYVLSSGYYDAYYLKAQKLRTLIRADFTSVFSKFDALLAPAAPGPAFRLGECADDPLRMYLADIFTIPANLAGLCAISLPGGLHRDGQGLTLPIGLQFLGAPLSEARMLRLAWNFEQATEWWKLRPSLARFRETRSASDDGLGISR